MSRCEWIVCERGNRWVAALRSTVTRHAASSDRWPRLYEVRSLDQLSVRVATRHESLVLIEVHRANLGSALNWLANANRGYPGTRFAALLDYDLMTDSPTDSHQRRQDVADALFEAGADAVAYSPRHLQHILQLGFAHGRLAAERVEPQNVRPLLEWCKACCLGKSGSGR